MSYLVKLESFEGPLDLLLHLIDKEEMDIYDIQISKITDQYLEYLNTMQSLQLDIASEFLVMASTLLSIKSKLLLPSRNESSFQGAFPLDVEEDPRDELIRRLIEYKKYKEVSMTLREKELERSQIFTKAPSDLTPFMEKDEVVNPVEGISIYHLIDAFQQAQKRLAYKEPITRVQREEISIKDRMNQIIELLQIKERVVYFSDLFENDYMRSDIVITFLSLLELMKQKQIVCIQSSLFEDIRIQYSPSNAKGDMNHGLQ